MTPSNARARRRQISAESAPNREQPSDRVLGAQRAPQGAQTLSAARLLTAEELAQRWQVPKQHVYRLSRRGDIPTVRIGRYFRYRVEAIERWEEEQANA